MKLPLLKLICAWMAFVTCTATAQTNIKKAFDAIIDNSIVTENHSLEMDPPPGKKSVKWIIMNLKCLLINSEL